MTSGLLAPAPERLTRLPYDPVTQSSLQVHLGFFPTEEQAARAYDRAAINKGARDGGKIITNMDISDYEHELDKLRRISQSHLVDALASEV